jgi:predicted Ser/Thr protein kinase
VSQLERYVIECEIGQGGMGTVYRAHDAQEDRNVALKELRLAPGISEERRSEIVERFSREAEAVAQLDSDHIVKVYDSFSEDGREFIVMELLEGQTLAEILKAGALPSEAGVGVAEQILDALTVAQAKGIVHRDLKPENIFVLPDGTVKVTDFGIAHVSSTEAGLTRAGQVLGTVGYMPPEQIRGATVDGRSDIFAVGVILYQMLSGVNPFGSEQPTTMMYRISYEEPAPLDPIIEGLPEYLTPLLVKAMAKDPDQRYQSAEEMLKDLRGGVAPDTSAILAAAATRAAEREKASAAAAIPPTAATPKRAMKLDRNVMIAAALALVLIVGGGIAAFATNQRKQQEAVQQRSAILAEGRRVNALMEKVQTTRVGLDGVTASLKAVGAANTAAVAQWDSLYAKKNAAYIAKAAEVERYNLAEQQKQASSGMESYTYQWGYNLSGQYGYWPVSTGMTFTYEAKHKKAPKKPKAPAKVVVNITAETAKLDQLTAELAALRSEVASQSADARYFQVAFQRVGEAVAALDRALAAQRTATAGLVRQDSSRGAIVEQSKLSALNTTEADPAMKKMTEELGLYLQNYGINPTELRSVEGSGSTGATSTTSK